MTLCNCAVALGDCDKNVGAGGRGVSASRGRKTVIQEGGGGGGGDGKVRCWAAAEAAPSVARELESWFNLSALPTTPWP